MKCNICYPTNLKLGSIQLFSNDDILVLTQASLYNLMTSNSSTINTAINFFMKIDHITGKTIWANSYEYVYNNNPYAISSFSIKNQQIWTVYATGNLFLKYLGVQKQIIKLLNFWISFFVLKQRLNISS